MPALLSGRGGLVPGLGDRPVRDRGDAFGFAFRALELGLDQQHTFGDVLPGDLVAIGVVDIAAGAASTAPSRAILGTAGTYWIWVIEVICAPPVLRRSWRARLPTNAALT